LKAPFAIKAPKISW